MPRNLRNKRLIHKNKLHPMLTNDLPEQQTASGMTVLPIQSTAHLSLPYADDGVHAGFPAPAQSTMESAIDLNKDLIDNPESTFYARVEGDSMIGANIHEGDILIIDRSLTPTNGDIALCIIDGEFTVKYLEINKDFALLRPANPDYPVLRVDHNNDFSVWGIVTYVIHAVKHTRRRF